MVKPAALNAGLKGMTLDDTKWAHEDANTDSRFDRGPSLGLTP